MDACKEWRYKYPVNKTWANFNTFFAKKYYDNSEKSKLTTIKSGYQRMHAVVGIYMALDNLAMVAMVDWDIVTKLTTANNNLAESVSNLKDRIGVEMSTIHELTKVTRNIQGTNKSGTEENTKNWKKSHLKRMGIY